MACDWLVLVDEMGGGNCGFMYGFGAILEMLQGRWPSGYGATFRHHFAPIRSSKERGFDPHPSQYRVLIWGRLLFFWMIGL